MSYYGNQEIISVTAKGSSETEFASATFKANVVTEGKTGPEAKERAFPIIEKIKKTIVGHAESAKIDTQRLKTTFSVEIDTHRTTGAFIGYKAVYSITFTGTNVAAAPAVHDALTSIEHVQSPTPIYNLNDSAGVNAASFANAVQKANLKFGDQCKALGLPFDDFYVQSWSIQEERPAGKTLSFTEGPTAKPIGMEPGKASFDMTVNFAYARKKA